MRLDLNIRLQNKAYRISSSSNNQVVDVYEKSTTYRSVDNQIEVMNMNAFPYKLQEPIIISENGIIYNIEGRPNYVVKVHENPIDIEDRIQVAALYKQLSDAKIGAEVPENFAFVQPEGKKPALYIVMKRYTQDLEDYLKQVRPDDIPRIEDRISFILDTMFDMGLIHIDAKPGNFLVDVHNNIVITDFDTEFVLTISGTPMANLLDGTSINVGPNKQIFLEVIKLQIARISEFKLFRKLNEQLSTLLNPKDVAPDTFDKDLEMILPSSEEIDDFNTFQKVLSHKDINRMVEHYKVAQKEDGKLYSLFTPSNFTPPVTTLFQNSRDY